VRRGAGLLLASVLAAAPGLAALAQDRPPLRPTRDVDVTYRSEQSGQVLEQRTRFAGQRMRLDTPTPGLYVIVDYAAQRMSMVSDADRGVLDMRLPPGVAPGTAATGATYVRRGIDRVAGLACTEWDVRDNRGQVAQTCFTDDGVLLRARRGPQVLAVATRVAYGAIDPALFAVPPGYARAAKREAP
jgi:hypothetical protein